MWHFLFSVYWRREFSQFGISVEFGMRFVSDMRVVVGCSGTVDLIWVGKGSIHDNVRIVWRNGLNILLLMTFLTMTAVFLEFMIDSQNRMSFFWEPNVIEIIIVNLILPLHLQRIYVVFVHEVCRGWVFLDWLVGIVVEFSVDECIEELHDIVNTFIVSLCDVLSFDIEKILFDDLFLCEQLQKPIDGIALTLLLTNPSEMLWEIGEHDFEDFQIPYSST